MINGRWILGVLLGALFISDAWTKLSIYVFETEFYRYSGYVKLSIELVFILYILATHNFRALIIPSILLTLVVIGSINNHKGLNIKMEGILEELYFFNRYCFIILAMPALDYILKNLRKHDFLTLFTLFMGLNSIFIYIGAISGLEFLKTFPNSDRFGYSGLISKSGEAAYIYMIFHSLIFLKYDKSGLTKWIILLLLATIPGVLTGQKSFILFLFLFHLLHSLVIGKRYLLIISALATLSVPIIIMYRLGVSVLAHFSPFWHDIYLKYSFWDTVTSLRYSTFVRIMGQIIEQWSWHNCFFGFGNFHGYLMELEFLDLFIFMGLLGGSIYLYLIWFKFFWFQGLGAKMLVASLLCIAALKGGFFISVTTMTILYLSIFDLSNGKRNLLKI